MILLGAGRSASASAVGDGGPQIPARTFLQAPASATRPPGPSPQNSSAADSSDNGIRIVPPSLRIRNLVMVPKGHHSSETGFAVGGQVILSLRHRERGRSRAPSNIEVKGRLTFKGQKAVELTSNLVPDGGRYSLRHKLSFSNLPLRFYGIGPGTPDSNEELYRPQTVLSYIELFRQIDDHWKAGLRYEYERTRLLSLERGGLLDSLDLRGEDGKAAFGAGILLTHDSRDRVYSPTRGMLAQGFAMWFDEELGSSFDFNVVNLDLRYYQSLAAGQVLALQGFYYSARGKAPFWRYAALGGRAHSRGYRTGRNLDRILLAFQGEYRVPIWNRAGVAVFAGLADVAPRNDSFRLEYMQPTVGAGLRWRTGGTDSVRARLDFSYGDLLRVDFGLDEPF